MGANGVLADSWSELRTVRDHLNGDTLPDPESDLQDLLGTLRTTLRYFCAADVDPLTSDATNARKALRRTRTCWPPPYMQKLRQKQTSLLYLRDCTVPLEDIERQDW